jgi:hypothetical protein
LFVPREARFQNLDIRLVLYDEPVWPSLDALSKKEGGGREGGGGVETGRELAKKIGKSK